MNVERERRPALSSALPLRRFRDKRDDEGTTGDQH
jgi:hypothetical protein